LLDLHSVKVEIARLQARHTQPDKETIW
jgi:hypothetical protein